MKFETVREFINLVDRCQHCGKEFTTEIVSKNSPMFSPSYTMTFDDTVFHDKDALRFRRAFKEKVPGDITYESVDEGKYLHFCYKMNEITHKILSIHKDTNNIIGDLDRIQKVFWDHKPVIRRQCYNMECLSKKCITLFEGTTLILERVHKKLFPFLLDHELLTIGHNDGIYGLATSHAEYPNVTMLMSQHDTIKQLPPMDLYKIKGGQTIYNKIQTLINFS